MHIETTNPIYKTIGAVGHTGRLLSKPRVLKTFIDSIAPLGINHQHVINQID
jgi:hypothetical protein